MSLKIRHKRINLLTKNWKLKKINPYCFKPIFRISNIFAERAFFINLKIYLYLISNILYIIILIY